MTSSCVSQHMPGYFHLPSLTASRHTLSPVISFENRCEGRTAWSNTRSVHQLLFTSQHASHKGGVPLAAKSGRSDASLTHTQPASQTIRARPMIEAHAFSLSISQCSLDERKVSKINAWCKESVEFTDLGKTEAVSLLSVGTLTLELEKRKGFG